MRRAYAVLLALCLALAGALATAGPAQAAAQTITNGTQFTDTSGNAVHVQENSADCNGAANQQWTRGT